MKALYETPAVELIKFAAMESIANDEIPEVGTENEESGEDF